jgi:hypothetical protein
MSLSLEDFFSDLVLQVAAESEACGDLSEDSFFSIATSYLIDSGDISCAERVAYFRPGVRVDGFTGDPRDEDRIVTIIVSDYCSKDSLESLNKAGLDTLIKQAVNFVSKCTASSFVDGLEETSPVFGLADLIRTRWPEITRVRIIVITNRILKIRSSSIPDIPVNGISCSVSLWDLSRLYEYVVSGKAKEDLVIDFSCDYGGALPALAAHLAETDYKSYLLVVPGEQLAQIYAKWGTQLLEKNVRVFLQSRGKVNKGIRETIENAPSMLFAYNNGLTATATSVETSPTRNGLALTSITNLQIVNGGQTTASIYDAWRRKKDLSKVFVQVKLSVVDAFKAEEIVPKISQYANSQNKVSAADFFSNHPFHIAIEQFSRQIVAPRADGSLVDSRWFYERARGQYIDEKGRLNSNAERRKFDIMFPRAQLVTKTDLAKYFNTWLRKPDVVSKGAQRNFSSFAEYIDAQWGKDSTVFNDVFFKKAIAKAILFRALERTVKGQDWYQGGYRANIVAYTISLLSHRFVRSGKDFNLLAIWQMQSVSTELLNELMRVAGDVHAHLVNPPLGSPANVTEYAKTARCWELLVAKEVKWSKAIDSFIVSKSETVKQKQEAKKLEKFESAVEAQANVIALGSVFWMSVHSWASERGFSSKDCGILLSATSAKFYPTERQAKYLLAILGRCEEAGYTM